MNKLRHLVPRRRNKASKLDCDKSNLTTTPPLTAAPSTATLPQSPPLNIASTFLPPAPSPAISPWLPETLWAQAYRKLQEKEPELVQAFERASGTCFTSSEQIQSTVKAQLDRREERQWIVAVAGKSVKVRQKGERLLKFILWSKDIVADAVNSQPYMALAWSGITMLLPVCGVGSNVPC